jgi:restriction system protein
MGEMVAEITKKRTGELLRNLFQILIKTPEGLPARQALQELAASVTLTPYESGDYQSTGDRRFEKIVRFATVDCVKAEWLLKHKGTWTVTPGGIAAYKEFPNPEVFYSEAVRLYRIWRKNNQQAVAQVETSDAAPLEQEAEEKETSITFEQAEEQAWGEIEQYLRTMHPFEFQSLVGDLLKAMGYHVAWISPPGKDGGLDLLAYTDPLGTRPPRIKVQVKRVVQKVSVEGLRSFVSLIGNDDVGLFVSTGGFTKDAEDFARVQESRKVTLIDMEKLVDLWTAHYGQLDDRARRRLPLTPIYFLTPQT